MWQQMLPCEWDNLFVCVHLHVGDVVVHILCEVKFCGVSSFVISKSQRPVGEKGLWNAALIFATFFTTFSLDSKLVYFFV